MSPVPLVEDNFSVEFPDVVRGAVMEKCMLRKVTSLLHDDRKFCIILWSLFWFGFVENLMNLG